MPAEELYPLAKLHEEEKKKNIREKGKYLHSVGFSVDGGHDDLY